MKSGSWFVGGAAMAALLVIAPPRGAALLGGTPVTAQAAPEARTVLSVRYHDGKSAKIELAGTPLSPRTFGKVEAEARKGAVSLKLKMENLDAPSRFGPYYTTFVLWGITPEGQITNLAEVPAKAGQELLAQMPVLQFGLVLTAEPYGGVKQPSPKVVAQNSLGSKPDGNLGTAQTSYRGVSDALYEPSSDERATLSAEASDQVALSVRQARRALTIAERAGAPQYANEAFGQARAKLAAVEALSSKDKKDEKKAGPIAREAIRMAEYARVTAVQAAEDARVGAERAAALKSAEQATADAERAKAEAEQMKAEAARAKAEAEQARAEAAAAGQAKAEAERQAAAAATQVDAARAEAAAAGAREETAKMQAADATRDAETARRERDQAHEQLYNSLNAILETRRESRGLIVNMSDVLFDSGRSTLRPEAREKLSKLAGVLLAYGEAYKLQFEGHTDSIGSDDFNMKLSQARAEAVRDYMLSAGISAARITGATGYGKTVPVASNDTDAGRARNRRVEIVIDDSEVRNPQ